MKQSWPLFITILVCSLSGFIAQAGTLTYVAVPATQSDPNSGITRNHGYTTAVDGGNTRGTDRALNGITLYSLGGAGQNSVTADNCTLNALSGTLTDAGLTSKTIEADGTVRDVMSDMVFNNAGGDNSQVEIVLDPESLEEGASYDLRIYIASSSGQNRQVNLAFFGDGQDGVQTGFFNEDDARTSPGRFQTAGQAYYINYHYTWDGDSTPGVTITQKFGGAPFCLYALTNELVEEGGATAAVTSSDLVLPADTDEAGTAAAGAEGGEVAGSGAEGEEGLSAGFVEQESDQIGVESDDFYESESLKSNGRWVKLSKWGTCWQPTSVSAGWTPYTNGSWKECEDCGWTFVSDEPWAWACYHYGRWAKVGIGCGWAWVPGSVWAPSWVSWRQGKDESCNCIGWAPLPPEAGCNINVGISSWVDSSCNIGPDYYTFVNIRDFGSDSYWGCGCIYDRGRNGTIIIDTFNITNICYNRHVNIYCGGPDYNWCNTRIRQLGGKECGRVYVNRYDNAERLGGKWARREGEQLGLVAPRIHGNKNPKFRPKIAESAGADQIDHGWKGIKDRKQEQQVRNHIAQETKGKNPRNSPAKLPQDAAEKMAKHGGGRHGKILGAEGAGQGAQGGQAAGAGRMRPGGKGGRHGQGANEQAQGQGAQGGATQVQTGGAGDQHPGKGRGRGQGKMGAGAGAAGAGAASGGGAGTAGSGQAAGGGFNQHPGKGRGRIQGQKREGAQMGTSGAGQAGTNPQAGAAQAAGGAGGRRRPGQSLGKKHGGGAGAGAGTALDNTGATQGKGGGATTATGGQHPGRGKGRGQRQTNNQTGQLGTGGAAQGVDTTGQAQGGGAGKKGRRNRGQGGGQGQGGAFDGAHTQTAAGQQNAASGQTQTSGSGAGRGKGKRRQQQPQQQQATTGGQSQGQMTTGPSQGQTSGGRQGRRRQKQQQQVQQGGQTQGQSQFSGGQAQGQGGQRHGGGGGARRQQQLQQQQAQQQQVQQQRQLQQQQLQQQRQLQQQQLQQQRQLQQQQQGGGGGGRGGRGGGGGRRRGATPTPPPG